MSEKEWQQVLIGTRDKPGLVQLYGWEAIHIHGCIHYRYNRAGLPDLFLRKEGKSVPMMLVAELKTTRGIVTEPQRRWLNAFNVMGASAYIWRPTDIDEVERILQCDPTSDRSTRWYQGRKG